MFFEELAVNAGWDKKQRKLFDLENVKFVKPKEVKEASLFSF